MAYNVKYRCTHKTTVNNVETTAVIEILENGYVGSVIDVKGEGSVYSLDYEKINPTEPFEEPIQKARLEFYLATSKTNSALNYDGIGILNDIFNADEKKYKMRLKKDGSILWTGYVLGDMIEYPEAEHVFGAKIVAKDLTRLQSFDFPLSSERNTIIKTISKLLDDLDYGINIETYTTWTEDNISATDDFLNQIYNSERALREFANNADEADESITNEDALNQILRNYGLILRQSDNAWKLYQLSAFETPTSVDEYIYDATGSQISTGSVDLTTPFTDTYVLPDTTTSFNAGVKRAKAKFDHRSTVVNTILPLSVEITGSQASRTYTGIITSDGNQSIDFSGDILFIGDINATEATGSYSIKAGDYSWNKSSYQWQTGSLVVNEFDVYDGPIVYNEGSVDEELLFIKEFGTSTDNLPADADGVLEFTLYRGVTELGVSQYTKFSKLSYTIQNPSVEEGNSTAIEYQLTQQGDYSKLYEGGEMWFGDGPTVYAVSALSSDVSGSILTSDSWKRKGDSATVSLYNLLLREIIDTQRKTYKNLAASIRGEYTPSNFLPYSGSNFFFIGGSITGKENEWNADFVEVNVNTSATDTFNIIYKTGEDDTTAGSSTTTSTSTTTTGLTQNVADGRYVNVTGDTMSGALTVNSTISATDGNSTEWNTAYDNHITGSDFNTSTGLLTLIQNNGGTITKDLDGRYGELASTNTWTDDQSFSSNIAVQGYVQADRYQIGGVTVIDSSRNFSGVNANFTGPLTVDTVGNIVSLNDGAGTEVVRIGGGGSAFNTVSTFNDNAVFAESAKTNIFNSGFGGNGWRINNTADAEFQNLTVRGTFSVYELLAKQIRATNGSLLVANSSKVEGVSTITSGSTYYLTFDTGSSYGHTFLNDDILIAQRLDVDNNSLYQSFLSVDAVEGTTALTASLLSGTVPESGFEYVRIGNSVNTDRQGHVYLTADDTNAPYIGVRDGVDAYTDFTQNTSSIEFVRVGKLDGVNSPNFGNLSGFGFWASGSAYLEGGVNATFGEIGGWSLTDATISGGNAELSSSGLIKNKNQINTNNAYQLNENGSGWFAGKNIEWNTAGNVSVQGNVTASNLRIDNSFSLGVNMTIDAGGSVTNSDSDYELSDTGFKLGNSTSAAGQLSTVARAIRFADNGTANGIRIWSDAFVPDVTELIIDDGTRVRCKIPLTVEDNAYFKTNTTASINLKVGRKANIGEAMNLKPQDPLPTGTVGDLAVSGSSLYFYNGAWTLVV